MRQKFELSRIHGSILLPFYAHCQYISAIIDADNSHIQSMILERSIYNNNELYSEPKSRLSVILSSQLEQFLVLHSFIAENIKGHTTFTVSDGQSTITNGRG